jgi:hypothetical protein
MQRNLSHRRAATSVLSVLAVSAAIAGCGGSHPSGSGTGTINAASIHNAALKFSACVRSHGVPDFPDPSSSSGGGQQIQATPKKMTVDGHALSESPRLVQKAMQQCQKYAPEAKGPPISAAQLTRIKAGALAMAKCMRANGVPNFPDPQVGTGQGGHGVSIGISAGAPGSKHGHGAPFNPQSPSFKAAQKKCQPLMTKVMPGSPVRKNG